MELVLKINEVLWGYLLMILLLGTGIYYTLKLKFIQVRKFKESMKQLTGGFKLNGKSAGKDGMSSFQAIATAIAAQVGTGNLAGAATAIVAGGPGAIFWMWVSAFFGMATVYAEAILGQVYKTRVNNQVTGGPAYYIQAIFGGNKFSKLMASFFALSCILALGFMGNAVQANSIASAFDTAFNTPPLYTGIIIAILSGFVFFGGIKRIASVTEKIVPIMALLYIIICLFIIGMNYQFIFKAIISIFIGAFSPKAVVGGAVGITVKTAIRYGVARGLFSNEAGMGSTPHAHAIAKVKKPSEQGIIAMITVFIDTFVVLTCTALVILTSNLHFGGATGILVTQKAFEASFGQGGIIFVAIALLFFSFSTIIGWYFFAEANVKYLFKSEMSLNIFRVVVMIVIAFGSMQKVDLVWELADVFNGLMVFPNLIALLILQNIVMRESKDLMP